MINKTLKLKTEKRTRHSLTSKMIIYTLLALHTLWVFMPFLTIIVTSVTPHIELIQSMQFVWWPKKATIDSYTIIFNEYFSLSSSYGSLLRGFLNTLWQTVPPMLVDLFVSGLSAFAFAKLKFPFKNQLFVMVVSIMMIPTAVMTLPSFLYYDALGWSAGPLPLIIPKLFGAAGLVFFLRQFISLIPDSIIEATRIDGANVFYIYLKIIIPLSMPAFITQAIFSFVSGYNAYQGPLLYLSSRPDLQPLQLVLSQVRGFYDDNKSVICASCIMAMFPVIFVYICSQKYFMENVSASGLKD